MSSPAPQPSPAPRQRPTLRVGVVGAGRVGAVLGAALRSAGHEVVGVSAVSDASRDRAEVLLPGVPVLTVPEVVRSAQLVLLAVPDDALTDLVRGAALVLGGDTGIAHLATALATPSMVLFGPVPPRWWGPLIDPHLHHVLWHGDPDADRLRSAALAAGAWLGERRLAVSQATDAGVVTFALPALCVPRFLGMRPAADIVTGVVVLVAAVCAVCGPIAFVALLAGPIGRRLHAGRTRLVDIGLVGALVVLAADYIAAYLVPGGANLPVGVVTGLAGAPFLLWLIATRSRVEAR